MELENGLDVDALGQATDNTFGRSSTTACATNSVKIRLVGDGLLQVDYLSSVTYASDAMMRDVMKKYGDESDSAINSAMKTVKAEYRRICDKQLKTKAVGNPDSSIEAVNMSPHSPIKRGFYRKRCVFEVK